LAAKHAVIGLSKAAAVEYAGRGIRINAIAPGLVRTPMTKHWEDDAEMRQFFIANTPVGRFAQAEEIANMVLFLCSDLASFAAGHTFAVDGGYTAR
jgi:NAD(P)-dependent dehydrogenase (short-subunit alcohol dehydrogenase family)